MFMFCLIFSFLVKSTPHFPSPLKSWSNWNCWRRKGQGNSHISPQVLNPYWLGAEPSLVPGADNHQLTHTASQVLEASDLSIQIGGKNPLTSILSRRSNRCFFWCTFHQLIFNLGTHSLYSAV